MPGVWHTSSLDGAVLQLHPGAQYPGLRGFRYSTRQGALVASKPPCSHHGRPSVSDGAPQGANCLNLPATPTGLTLTEGKSPDAGALQGSSHQIRDVDFQG